LAGLRRINAQVLQAGAAAVEMAAAPDFEGTPGELEGFVLKASIPVNP
jgi:hypothetical protein